MKLLFTRKTWYFLLVIAAALSMADGFALLVGMDTSFLEVIAFGGCGLSALFLAAEKDASAQDAPALKKHAARKANPQSAIYFAAFALLLVSYILFGNAGAMRLTLFWPVLAMAEYRRGVALLPQLRLLVFAEVMQAAALLCSNAGISGFAIVAAVLWILTCAARGWVALILYKNRMDTTE